MKPSAGNTSAGSAPKPPRTLLNLTWLCTKAWTWPGRLPPEPSPEPCWNWPGSAPQPPRPSPEASPEPSLEPRWTWPGACTSAHQSYSGLKTPLAYAVGGRKKIKPRRPTGPECLWHRVSFLVFCFFVCFCFLFFFGLLFFVFFLSFARLCKEECKKRTLLIPCSALYI